MPNCGRIGWSDFVFFFSFMYIVLLIRISIPKISNFGHACITHASILSFSKNHRALIHYFFLCGKFAETFLYIKEQLSEIKFKMKFFKIFFCIFQKCTKRFLICTREKNICFSFFSVWFLTS